jgi:hypothetical protein
MATPKTEVKKVFTLAQAFVVSQKARWGHDDWEKLLEDLEKEGVDMEDDEARRNLGNILEGGKHFFVTAAQAKDPQAKT